MVIDLFENNSCILYITAKGGKPTLCQHKDIYMSLYVNPTQESVDKEWVCPIGLDTVVETLTTQHVDRVVLSNGKNNIIRMRIE